jgi:hypothetical protein
MPKIVAKTLQDMTRKKIFKYPLVIADEIEYRWSEYGRPD